MQLVVLRRARGRADEAVESLLRQPVNDMKKKQPKTDSQMIRQLIITAFAVKLAHLLPIVCVWMTNIIAGRRHIKSNKAYKTKFFGERKQKNGGGGV